MEVPYFEIGFNLQRCPCRYFCGQVGHSEDKAPESKPNLPLELIRKQDELFAGADQVGKI